MKIKLGIIGCGGHAVHHVRNLGPDFDPCIAWDPILEELPFFDTHRVGTLDILLASEADAVFIGSPDAYHLEQISYALEAGKHVLCEKPLLEPGQSLNQLEAQFALAREKKLVLSTCHPRRFDRPFVWLRARREEFKARFGDVSSFTFDFSYHKPKNSWKHKRSLLLDHVNHEVDLMSYLFGIQGFDAWKLYDSHDRYAVAGVRDDGIVFYFHGTRRLDAWTYPEWCRVRFERGEVELDMRLGIARVSDHQSGESEAHADLGIDHDGRLLGVMADFARQIRGDAPGYLTEPEMLMNTEAGILLQQSDPVRIDVRET